MKRISVLALLVMVACGFIFTSTASAKRLPRGAVVWTIDDGESVDLQVAKILKKYNFPVTSFVITGRIGTPGYLSVKDMKKLSRTYRWEFQNHTDDHKYFSTMSDWEIFNDIRTATQKLRNWGFRNVVALAPPGGDYGEGEGNIDGNRLIEIIVEEGSISMCRQAYPQDSSDLSTMINSVDTFDPMRIKVFSIKRSTVGDDPGAIPDTFYNLVWSAREEGTMVVFLTHGVGSDPSDDYKVEPSVLNSMVGYVKRQLKTRKLQVLPLTQAVNLMNAHK